MEPPHSFLITASVSDFITKEVHIPGQKSKYNLSLNTCNRMYMKRIYPEFYLNGDTTINEGYVSIHLPFSSMSFLSEYTSLTCFVSVIDVHKNERYMRSFTFDIKQYLDSDNECKFFPMSRYIARETLLNEPSVLLPENCFTVHIKLTTGHVSPINERLFEIYQKIESGVFFKKVGDGFIGKVKSDSEIGRILCEHSSVFRDMADLTSKTDTVIELPSEDCDQFIYLCKVILHRDYVHILSVAQLCELYRIADKYNIQVVFETCRDVFKCLFSLKNEKIVGDLLTESQTILGFADMCNDEYLKEEIKAFLEKNETKLQDTSSQVWECEDFGEQGLIFTRKKSDKFQFYT